GELIIEHEVYISNDGESWKGPVAYGMWPDLNRQGMAVIDPAPTRYVRLVANAQATEVTEPSSVGISELNVYATVYTIPQDPKRGSSWGSDELHSTPGGKTVTTRWNPLDNTVSKCIVTDTHHDMFCPGISIDGTGVMVVTGGNDASQTSLYNATTGKWVERTPMNIYRGYQASITTSRWSCIRDRRFLDGEVWDSYTQRWTLLPGAIVKPMLTNDMEGAWRADNHGRLFGWKKNTNFQAGPSVAMNWYYTEGEGSFCCRELTEGKILTISGSPDYDKAWATSNAHIITLGEPGEKPTVQPAGQDGMIHWERVFHTSVVLPDGKVLIAGGQTFGVTFNEENVQFVQEIYDPKTDKFIQLQENNFVRVLNGGGGLGGNCSANHYDAQIFRPPYLLTETGELCDRPEILSGVPEIAKVGGLFVLQSNDLIMNASLVRLCTTTHSTVNTDQRWIPLRLIPLPRRKSSFGIRLPDELDAICYGQEWRPSIAKTMMITVNNKKTLDAPQELLDEFNAAEQSHYNNEARISYWPSWRPTLIMQIFR
ncbi:Galactose oxidase/kelch beta-propeller, partial [Penicillium cf. viridicatum]